jgi:hypothetical protein
MNYVKLSFVIACFITTIIIMVRYSYQNISNIYGEMKQLSCGRLACSVMIMVAYEVTKIGSYHNHDHNDEDSDVDEDEDLDHNDEELLASYSCSCSIYNKLFQYDVTLYEFNADIIQKKKFV